MCTLICMLRPAHRWPLLIAANRDEMRERPWSPPARHWPDRAEVIAGRDQLAGGSWLGINENGVVAAILNRKGSLGPAAGKRSRGELVLEALDHSDAGEAALALANLEPAAYRSFNMLIADNRHSFWLRNRGAPQAHGIEVFPLTPGLHMLTAFDLDDTVASARTRHYLPLFREAGPPDPDSGDWQSWQSLLRDRATAPADGEEGGPGAAMTVVLESGFETVSSSLLALPATADDLGQPPRRPVWLFAPGRPDRSEYEAIKI